VTAHATSAKDLRRALDAGVDDVVHMAVDRVSDKVIRRMVDADVSWVPTLEALGNRDQGNLRRFVKAGGRVALGNDGGYLAGIEVGMPMREIQAMHDAGMTPMQIVVAATRDAAYVCRRADVLGTLEVGKYADILVVNGDPLRNLDVLRDVQLVIHEGIIIRNKVGPTVTPSATMPPPTTTPVLSDQPSPETRTRSGDNMTIVYVPGGTFLMGSTEAQIEAARTLCDEYPDDYGKCNQAAFGDEVPPHAVTLDSFWLDGTEVTNAQYALCVAEGACRASRLADDPDYNGDDYPAAGIPWQAAADYCAWAGGRLPTEAEWAYAARGTEGALFPWGDAFDCAGGNFWDDGTGCDDGYAGPAPAGSFPQGSSWCGALDMAGNVWEWVADAYGPYLAEAQVNPTGPSSGDERVLRGGSWGYVPAFVRGAYRYPAPATADYLAVGFRCAVSAADQLSATVEGPGHDVQLRDTGSGQGVDSLRVHSESVMGLAFSPDGALLATADGRGTIKVWDVVGGRAVHTLSGHISPVRALAFSSDGALLASGSVEGSQVIKLWDMEDAHLDAVSGRHIRCAVVY
jgi:formylglycine-generating enzyme required for sulfatase activity